MVSSDFNGDGKSDILWQNDNGQVAIWELNGTTVIGGGIVGNPGPSWEVIATGDFNGDGISDILWQNDSGEVDIWEMNGTSLMAAPVLPIPVQPGTSDRAPAPNLLSLWGRNGSITLASTPALLFAASDCDGAAAPSAEPSYL